MKSPVEAARSWLTRAEGQSDPFDRFVSLWIAFNVLYGPYHTGSERQAIREFVRMRPSPRQVTERLLNQSHVRFFHARIIRDVRGLHSDHHYRVDTLEQATTLRNTAEAPQRRLTALLLILYQVRCNLFHGNKLYERDADEQVVGNAADALMELLRPWLSQEGRP